MRFQTLLLLCAIGAAAQSHPDFTGTWKLNPTASEYPNAGGIPTRLVRTIDLKGDNLHYTIDRELNGKPERMDFELRIGSVKPDARVTAKWNGELLILTAQTGEGGRQLETWELSKDRKNMVDRTLIQRPDGTELKLRRVYERQ